MQRSVRGAVLLAALSLALLSCGGGEAPSSAVEIERAEWRGTSVLVTGGWMKGVATPPTCRITEGRDGPANDYFEPDARVSLDGNAFSKEFVPRETLGDAPLPETRGGYHVRCTVSMDSGRSAEAVMEIKGAP